ncbi:MAG TPA: type II toxin-antitoxin system RelE/ParE family toxin [Hyphomicrobiaceae bacterium]|nr:type II toxin-antitoxin system RelE/ParE family toxin [Hyphomicrobiaceae bacterium]
MSDALGPLRGAGQQRPRRNRRLSGKREAGAKVARTVLQRIRRQVRTLEHSAHRFRERPELGVGRRAMSIGPWIAFYRIEGETVFVQRILHSARDIKLGLFDE